VLDFRILGPLEVRDDAAVVPVGGEKQRAVLAILLLERGRVVPTDRLIDTLWGENPPRTAATSLQNFVSQLRKQLGADVLETRPPGYRIRIAPEQLDLARFERLVEEARGAPARDRADRLHDALALWRGSPLADLQFESWAQPQINRLEELRLTTVEDRLEAELEAGRRGEIVGELEALVDAHPHRERLRGLLMLALYRSGRQADALKAYQTARRALVDELGIEPSPELQRLHASILRQEAGLETARAEAPARDQLEEVARALLAGRLVPVLGADVADLAARLAERFAVPDADLLRLPQIAQYVSVMQGSGPLYDELHALLDAEAPPTAVHAFFASLPPLLRSRGAPHQLLVTTGYDLALERAFLDAGEEFDVVAYLAAGRHRGRFCHVTPAGAATVIDLPNTYATELSLERRTIVLKLHGGVDRTPEREWESFVVTEDDYIGYLPYTELANALPITLAARLRRSHFLFLGYTMADWNLRVVLNRLWGDQPLTYRSWAVQPEPKQLEREFWRRRDVDVSEAPLERYVAALARHAGLESVETSA
jgi:DNA-binding SARP family transcriptional activator